MSTTTSVFAGNAAVAYAAFNLRDPYYPEMARFVINAAKAKLDGRLGTVVDIGAGIGMSTMEILKDDVDRVIAVEPEEGMRYFCELNTMGDPRVQVIAGRGEELIEYLGAVRGRVSDIYNRSETADIVKKVDAVLCCQVFHLFNPPGKESLVPRLLSQVAKALRVGGVFAFDLGPSNFEFATPLADHRSGGGKRGEIITELAHPLYQRAHEILLGVVRREFPALARESLWPPAAARMSFKYLNEACEKAGLRNLEVSEELSPVSGKRVINFIRNGWTVFFRWPPLSELPTDRKLELMKEALNRLFQEEDFSAMSNVMSYHPTAVFTAVKS